MADVCAANPKPPLQSPPAPHPGQSQPQKPPTVQLPSRFQLLAGQQLPSRFRAIPHCGLQARCQLHQMRFNRRQAEPTHIPKKDVNLRSSAACKNAPLPDNHSEESSAPVKCQSNASQMPAKWRSNAGQTLANGGQTSVKRRSNATVSLASHQSNPGQTPSISTFDRKQSSSASSAAGR